MREWGIRARVLLLAVLPTLFATAALATYAAYAFFRDLEQNLVEQGQLTVRRFAALGEYGVFSSDSSVLKSIATAALDDPHISGIAYFDHDADPLVSSGPITLQHADWLEPVRNPPALSAQQRAANYIFSSPIYRQAVVVDDPFLLDPIPAGSANSQDPIGWVTLAVSTADIDSRKRSALGFILGASVVTTLIAILIAFWLGARIVLPIRRLAEAFSNVGPGNVLHQVSTDSTGELKELEKSFNQMAAELYSHHHEMEQRIQAATAELAGKKEEAERTSQAKSRFLAAASHDLRQPMQALRLFVSDLQRQADAPHIRELSRKIGVSVETTSSLLDALLDISRLDLAGVSVYREAFAIADLFARLMDAYQRPAREKGLRLRFRANRLWVNSDMSILARLLGNLIGNAIRHTPRGTILVAARYCRQGVRIEVRDSGIGIPLEYQKSVFEEFFQVGNTERELSKGLGLGLSIASRLAKAMDTEVTLRSAPGKGSTFALTLPRAATPDPAQQAPSQPPGVVIIDTGSEIGEQLDRLLNQWEIPHRRHPSPGRTTSPQLPEDGEIWLVLENADLVPALSRRSHLPVLILLGEWPEEMGPDIHRMPLPIKPARLRALLRQLQEQAGATTPTGA